MAQHAALSHPPREIATPSERQAALWRALALDCESQGDAALAKRCEGWVREPVPQGLRFGVAMRALVHRLPLTLAAIAGPWNEGDDPGSLHPFFRLKLAVDLIDSPPKAKKPLAKTPPEAILDEEDEEENENEIIVLMPDEDDQTVSSSAPGSSDCAEPGLFATILLRGVAPKALCGPLPQLGGVFLLPKLFAADTVDLALVGEFAKLGLDLAGTAGGASATLLLVRRAIASQRHIAASELAALLALGAPADPGALRAAVLAAIDGAIKWDWPTALAEAGSSLSGLDEKGFPIACQAFGKSAEPAAIERAMSFFAERGLDWSERSSGGTTPPMASLPSWNDKSDLASQGRWWLAAKDIEAAWTGEHFLEGGFFDAATLASSPNAARFFAWMDEHFSPCLAEELLESVPVAGRAPCAFEQAFAAWAAGLAPAAREAAKGTAAKHCPASLALANPPGPPGPTVELYTPERWAEFSAEYLEVPDGVHAFAKKLQKRVKSMGESHRIKPLALAEKLMEGLPQLRIDFPHFAEVIDHLEDHCWLQAAGDRSFYIPPMLLVGGPGVGKTFFFKRVSECVQTAYKVLHMESMSGSMVITGMASQWSDSRPGAVFASLDLGLTGNPIILLDEIDKCPKDSKMPPDACLLPLLEPHTAAEFQDECVPLKWDARRICWVATANEIGSVSAPLKSRLDVFQVRSPNARERRALCSGVYRSILGAHAWGPKMNPALPEAVLDRAAEDQGPGATRDLRRALTTACAKAIRSGRSIIEVADLPNGQRAARKAWDAAIVDISAKPPASSPPSHNASAQGLP
jgi:hypothetical protein